MGRLYDKVCLILTIMSLGGLPPFLGFLSKLIIIKNIILLTNTLLLIIIIYSSIIVLIIYIYYCYVGINLTSNHSINTYVKYLNYVKISYTVTIFMLPVAIIIL